MNRLILILLFISSQAFGQTPIKQPFLQASGSLTNRYAFTNVGLYFDSSIYAPTYKTTGTDTVVLGFTTAGKGIKIPKSFISRWGGGSGANQNLQQVLTTGSTLTTDNVINAGSNDFSITNADKLVFSGSTVQLFGAPYSTLSDTVLTINGSFVRKRVVTGGTDTTSLSNRIDLKYNTADTLNKWIAKGWLPYLMKYTDTVALSNRINQRIKYTDTLRAANVVSSKFYADSLFSVVGSSATLQQVMTNSSLLSSDNTINAGSNDLSFTSVANMQQHSIVNGDNEKYEHYYTDEDAEWKLYNTATPFNLSRVFIDINNNGRNNVIIESQSADAAKRSGIDLIACNTSNVNDGTLRFSQTAGNFEWSGLTQQTSASRLLGVPAGGTVEMGYITLGNGVLIPSGVITVDSSKFSTKLWRQKGIDSLSALIGAQGLQDVINNDNVLTQADTIDCDGFPLSIENADEFNINALATSIQNLTVDASIDTVVAIDANGYLYKKSGSGNYIQNQNASAQASANWWIDGTGTAQLLKASSANSSGIEMTNTNTSSTSGPYLSMQVTGQNAMVQVYVPKDAAGTGGYPYTLGSRGTAFNLQSPGNMYFVTTATVAGQTDYLFYVNKGAVSPPVDSLVKFNGEGEVYIYHPQDYIPNKDTVLYQDPFTGQLKRTRINKGDSTVIDNAGTLNMSTLVTTYVFNGTTSTWTLPSAANRGSRMVVINIGSGTITTNSNAGGNDIIDVYGGSLTPANTVNVPTATKVEWFSTGTYWVMTQ